MAPRAPVPTHNAAWGLPRVLGAVVSLSSGCQMPSCAFMPAHNEASPESCRPSLGDRRQALLEG